MFKLPLCESHGFTILSKRRAKGLRKSRNIFFANEVFSAVLDYSVSLFRNILYISCCHHQINMTEKPLN